MRTETIVVLLVAALAGARAALLDLTSADEVGTALQAPDEADDLARVSEVEAGFDELVPEDEDAEEIAETEENSDEESEGIVSFDYVVNEDVVNEDVVDEDVLDEDVLDEDVTEEVEAVLEELAMLAAVDESAVKFEEPSEEEDEEEESGFFSPFTRTIIDHFTGPKAVSQPSQDVDEVDSTAEDAFAFPCVAWLDSLWNSLTVVPMITYYVVADLSQYPMIWTFAEPYESSYLRGSASNVVPMEDILFAEVLVDETEYQDSEPVAAQDAEEDWYPQDAAALDWENLIVFDEGADLELIEAEQRANANDQIITEFLDELAAEILMEDETIEQIVEDAELRMAEAEVAEAVDELLGAEQDTDGIFVEDADVAELVEDFDGGVEEDADPFSWFNQLVMPPPSFEVAFDFGQEDPAIKGALSA